MKKLNLFIAFLLFTTPIFAQEQEIPKFTFVLNPDIHINYPTAKANTWYQKTISEINALSPLPAFIINAGDMVEAGLRREFDKYREIADTFDKSIKVYGVPGNHDVTRGMGGLYFLERIGPTHHSFLYPPDAPEFLFLLLNGNLFNHGSGHFSRQELAWTENELKKTDTKYPGIKVITAWHHPSGESHGNAAGEGAYVDNDKMFLELVKKYNIMTLFFGHTHSNAVFKGNDGIPAMSTTGVYKTPAGGGFVVANVFNDRMVLQTKLPDKPIEEKPFQVISSTAPRYPAITIVSPQNDEQLINTCKIQAKIKLYHDAAVVKAECQVDDGGCPQIGGGNTDTDQYWQAMELVTSPELSAQTTINVDELLKKFDQDNQRTSDNPWYYINGIHRVRVRFTTSDGRKWYATAWPHFTVRNDWPTVKWRKDLGQDIQGDIVCDNKIIYINPYGNLFYAIDSETGGIKWSFDKSKYGEIWEESSGPVTDKTNVYFGSYNGNLFALDKKTGQLKWNYTVPVDIANEIDKGFTKSPTSIFGSPAVNKDTVYFGAVDGYLYAVDAKTGQQKWRYQAAREGHGGGGEQSHKEIVTKPLIINDKIYFANYAGSAHCVNSDGTDGWGKPAAVVTSFYFAPSRATMTGNKDRLYCSSYSKGLFCLDTKTGKTLWSKGGDTIWGSLGANETGTRAYVRAKNNVLHAFNAADEIWSLPLEYKGGEDLLRNQPTAVNGTIYTGSFNGGTIVAIKDNNTSGKLLWKYRSGIGGVTCTPIVKDKVVYVGTLDGHIAAIK